jgi:hypothetical protein
LYKKSRTGNSSLLAAGEAQKKGSDVQLPGGLWTLLRHRRCNDWALLFGAVEQLETYYA